MNANPLGRFLLKRGQGLRGDRGAILVISALVIVVLLVFAAFAVDLGYVWAQRRSAQNIADVSVLSGAVEISLTANAQGAVDAVIAQVDANTPGTFSVADWTACTDTPPSDFDGETAAARGLSPATNCIWFSKGGDEMRVRIPNWQQSTFFAQVIGISSIDVSAAAHANIQFPGVAAAPPFVVTAGIGGGEEVCLRTSPGSTPIPKGWVGNGTNTDATQDPLSGPTDPCDDSVYNPASEFFGTLWPYVYEDTDGSPAFVDCSRTGGNATEYAIAEGIDHQLSFFSPKHTVGDPEKVDGDGCPQGPAQLFPNTMDLQNGLTAQNLRSALLSLKSTAAVSFDGNTWTPRLHRGNYVQATYTFAGEKMDNQPVWNFIRSNIASASVPDACKDVYAGRSSPLWDYYDLKEEMIRCLKDWNRNTSIHVWVFDESIVDSSRFAFLPQISENSLVASPVHFDGFVPVWIQKLYQEGKSKSSPDSQCWSTTSSGPGNPSGWYWHEAGQKFDCALSTAHLDRISGLVLRCGMLPATICDPLDLPGNPDAGDPVETIELTR